jgi:hypothetical protein
MIKLNVKELAAEVLSIAAAHGFSSLGLKKVTDMLTAHVADASIQIVNHTANAVAEEATVKLDEVVADVDAKVDAIVAPKKTSKKSV